MRLREAVPLLLLSLKLAYAADGVSLDTELVRPTFAADTIPGFDSPTVTRGGALRVGVASQLERDPLVRYEADTPVGAVVKNRVSTVLGASLDFNTRVSARLSVPLVAQWGSEIDALSGDGVFAGDIGAGVRVEALNAGPFTLAGRVDLAIPTGGRAAWVAEEGVRFSPGAVAGLSLGRVGLLAEAGVTLRKAVTTTDALTVGTELTSGLGATVAVVPDLLDAYAGALGRFGLAAGAGAGGTAVEALVGARVHPVSVLDVDLAAGRGLTRGYGGTEYRVLAAVTFHAAPREKVVVADAAPAPAAYPTDDVLDISGLEEAPEPEPEPVVAPPLARVEQKQIVIRDPLQFERDTDRILPESLDTLAVVAALMNENPDIAQLVIEGHASGEGSFAHNYKLSVARALAVFQALVEAGVHPSRMACRGWGEVSPAVQGEGDEALAANRRVMFHIAHRLAPGEANPGWSTALTLPWNGEARTLPPPPAAPAVAPAPTPTPRPAPKSTEPEFDPEQFDPDLEDGDDE